MDKIDSFFKITERKSDVVTEIRAGFTTFLTLGYILAVNPMILADSGGTCPCDTPPCWDPAYEECLQEVRRDLVIVTALTSGIACFLMGVAANLPFALAPGMGMNAYFTYGVVGFRGTGVVSYTDALGAVFIEGIIFMLLSVTGFRKSVATLLPKPVVIATTGGIGMFLALLGMQTAEGIGYVVSDGATGLTAGGCPMENRIPMYACPNTKGMSHLGIPDGIPTAGPGAFGLLDFDHLNDVGFTPWYDCLGGTNNVYTCDTVVTNWQYAGAQGPFPDAPIFHGGGVLDVSKPWSWPFAEPRTMLGFMGLFLIAILMKMKIKGSIIIAVGLCSIISWVPGTPFEYWGAGYGGSWDYFTSVVEIRTMSTVFGHLSFNPAGVIGAITTFFIIDFLDTSATLFSMADMCQFTDKEGKFEGITQAYIVDGFATTMGAVFGTSPVTTYIESAPGILEGGRTGLTAVVVSFWFFLSTFFAPILASIPAWCTGSALIIVGAMMMKGLTKIKWEDPQESIPAFLTIITMPFTYSIAYGLLLGICCWCIMAIFPPHPAIPCKGEQTYDTAEDAGGPAEAEVKA
jgi:AGZA family xanthine/uracil permease-like MFS transporter